jgi:hypothetical protein
VGDEPGDKLIAGSDLEGVFESCVNSLNANEKGTFAEFMDFPSSGQRFEGLACARIGEDEHATFVLDFVPACGFSGTKST